MSSSPIPSSPARQIPQNHVPRSINHEIINRLIENLSLDHANPEWADLSHHFQSIENTVVEKSMPYPSVTKLAQLQNVLTYIILSYHNFLHKTNLFSVYFEMQ